MRDPNFYSRYNLDRNITCRLGTKSLKTNILKVVKNWWTTFFPVFPPRDNDFTNYNNDTLMKTHYIIIFTEAQSIYYYNSVKEWYVIAVYRYVLIFLVRWAQLTAAVVRNLFWSIYSNETIKKIIHIRKHLFVRIYIIIYSVYICIIKVLMLCN